MNAAKKADRAEIEAFVGSDALDRATGYGRRGRVYQSLLLDELKEKWRVAFQALADDPAHPEKRAPEDDLASEFTLRGIERPFDLVKDDIDRYRFAVDGVIEQMR